MPEHDLRNLVLSELKRLINASVKVAERVKSETREKWVRLIVLLKNNHDHFDGEEPEEITAKRDLDEFIATFKAARIQLWGEVQAKGGGKVKLTKRVKKFKGKKTPFMETQRTIFLAYVRNGHPVTRSMKADRRAHDCWEHEHKSEWDRAAKNGTGYKTYKMLGRAYRNTK